MFIIIGLYLTQWTKTLYGLPLLIKRIKIDLIRMYSKGSLNSYKPEAN